jgi:hypothetical protein
VNRLRRETGQHELYGEAEGDNYLVISPPDWFDNSKPMVRFNATPVIDGGGSPLPEILSLANKLQEGEILEVTTPFVPAPVIDMLREKGFRVFSMQKDRVVSSYFVK